MADRTFSSMDTASLSARVLGSPETAAWGTVAAGADETDFDYTSEPSTHTTVVTARTAHGADVLQAMLVRGDAVPVREGARATRVSEQRAIEG